MKETALRKGLPVLLCAFLVLTGCLFSPDNDPNENPPPVYYEPADSAWKVVANLQTAYVNRDHENYMNCFRDDFEFHLLETDWADYNGDGITDTYWGLDSEDEFHLNMFNAVEQIELTFTGTNYTPGWATRPV